MWTAEQLDELAQVSEADRQAAMVAARRYMGPRYREMLDTGDGDSDWQYAAALGLFLYRGQKVKPEAVRRQLDRVMAGLEAETKAQTGDRDMAAWMLAMVRIIKITALVGAAFAAGGWALADAFGRDVEAHIADELGYLNAFADGVQSGDVPRDGRFARRAMLYAATGWALFNSVLGTRAKIIGHDEERSVLDPGAEHCLQCVEEADKDWQPIGTLVHIGDRTCLSDCRCFMEYRTVNEVVPA